MSEPIPKVHEMGGTGLGGSKKKLRQLPSLPAVPDEESVCHGAPSLGSMKCELRGSVKRSDTPAVLNLSEKEKLTNK